MIAKKILHFSQKNVTGIKNLKTFKTTTTNYERSQQTLNSNVREVRSEVSVNINWIKSKISDVDLVGSARKVQQKYSEYKMPKDWFPVLFHF